LAYAVVSVGAVPPVLPFPLYVTEYVVAVHVAVNVTLPDTVPDAGYLTPAAYVDEPSLHPANVKPALVYVLAGVVNVPPYDTDVGDDGADPEPPVPAA